MKYASITISGPVASGTTTAAKALAEKFSLPYKSTGAFFRQYMLENNIPLPNKEAVPDDVERQVDAEFTNLLKDSPGVVVDSLYAGYFTRDMPHVLKVLLTCDKEERIKRAIKRSRTHIETAKDVITRDQAHDAKFRKLYANEGFLDP
ncbi:cytidylate kinase family protein [Candidatus Curtissbacteria bacterium]|nr:cytidylate kinase family protein [Candidatus Curtissbacteria bacterium]